METPIIILTIPKMHYEDFPISWILLRILLSIGIPASFLLVSQLPSGHGVLENVRFISDFPIFLWKRPIDTGFFPASHVWWHQRVKASLSHGFPMIFQFFHSFPRVLLPVSYVLPQIYHPKLPVTKVLFGLASSQKPHQGSVLPWSWPDQLLRRRRTLRRRFIELAFTLWFL